MDKDIIERIVKLYFNGCGAREAIEIANKNLKLENIKVSRGWKYQQLKLGGIIC